MRQPSGAAAALVVGVYPSAFHVAWSPPVELDPRDVRKGPFIGSLAVDVEPVVFWDGAEPAPSAELERWMGDVGFDPQVHGQVTTGTNGPSGSGLVEQFLTPLKVDPALTAFTDAMPWYFVKYDKGGQGLAIRDRFGPLAAFLGVHNGSLPSRPSTRELVALAGSDARRVGLRRELVDADAPLVITLGQEALDAVRAVCDATAGVQVKLSPHGYGAAGELLVDSKVMSLLPLVHPGFARQTKHDAWRAALQQWRADL